MTLQEIFDTAVRGVLLQGGPSIGPAGRVCLLRGDYGRKCALGHLIPDEAYFRGMEGQPRWYALLALGEQDTCGPVALFLDKLRDAHDNAARFDHDFVPGFRRRARELARNHDLSTTVLDEVPAR